MSILRHFSVRTLQLQAADFCLQACSQHWMLGYGWLQCQWIDTQINLIIFLLSTKQIGQKKRGVHKVSIKSKNHLKRVVILEWEAISLEICRNFVNSMHRRCVSVTRAKGLATKYWHLKCLMLVCFFSF